jgi:hypothetical protein
MLFTALTSPLDHLQGAAAVSVCPWRIGAIVAAALVLLHHEHDRTT